MWPFGEKVTVYEYSKEAQTKVEENKVHNFWLYWHGHTATVVTGPFAGHWGVAQCTDSESQTVELAISGRKGTLWFKAARLIRQEW